MELTVNKREDGNFEIRDGNWTLMHVYRQSTHPDFDPERTCRMIEKMEDMLQFMKDYFAGNSPSLYFDMQWGVAKRGKRLLDYIEHENKEDIVLTRQNKDDQVTFKRSQILKLRDSLNSLLK